MSYRAKIDLIKAREQNAKLRLALKEMTLLFRTSLLCTNAEIAKDGMEFVRAAEKLLEETA